MYNFGLDMIWILYTKNYAHLNFLQSELKALENDR